MSSDKNMMLSRESAFKLATSLFGELGMNYSEFMKKAKPARLYTKATIATTPAEVAFFQLASFPVANIQTAGKLGQFFFICNDIRIFLAEQTGLCSTAADIAKILMNCYLTFEVEGQTYIDREPLHLYARGLGAKDQANTKTDNVLYEPGGDTGERHHDLIPVMPDQPVKAVITPDQANCASITTATIATMVLYGWKFQRVTAG